jgi:uncharacterized protein (DUF2236 family)
MPGSHQIQINTLYQEIDQVLSDACPAYMLKELKEKMPPRQASDIVNYVKAMMVEFNPTKKTRKYMIHSLAL